jgi:hypothetical protein
VDLSRPSVIEGDVQDVAEVRKTLNEFIVGLICLSGGRNVDGRNGIR